MTVPGTIAPGESYAALSVETYHPVVRDFVSAAAFRVGANVNVAFFCAGDTAKGFPAHYDTFHSILVQLEGAKKWSVHRGPVAQPALNHEWPALSSLYPANALEKSADEDRFEFVLEPGDVLWIPPGWVHRGMASSSGSVHSTIGVSAPRLSELVASVLSNSEHLPWMRDEVPPSTLWEPAEARSMVSDALRHLASNVSEVNQDRFSNAASHWRRDHVARQFPTD